METTRVNDRRRPLTMVAIAAMTAALTLGSVAAPAVAGTTPPDGAGSRGGTSESHAGKGRAASCGLDRIDQRNLPLDGRFARPWNGGAGVTVYVIDSGIDYTNAEFGSRASLGFDAFGGDGADVLGNGTAMASIIGGERFGIANKASLVSVKVIDDAGGGTPEGLLAGIEWVTANARKPAVVSFPIGLPANDVVDDAVRRSIRSGITWVIEAGGDASDAGQTSPARLEEGIVVAASDCSDGVASFSAFGSSIDFYAPGVDITAAAIGGGSGVVSGTQFAAAHAAGAAAVYLSRVRHATPRDVERALVCASTGKLLSGVPAGTANRLLRLRG